MTPFAELLQQGAGNAWLFFPTAILLGALHGLEPGHSKTMMAAFIVAVRGTVTQAVLLGLAATVSHTLIVWGIAIGGMYLWRGVAPETFEPYLQFVSAIVIIAMAFWMLWRTWKTRNGPGRRAIPIPAATVTIMGTAMTMGTSMTVIMTTETDISHPRYA